MTQGKPTIIPSRRYRDCPKAIEWLCSAFGFEKHAVYPGPDNTIAHAELAHGNGMIMLGSINDTPFSKYMVQPDEIGGRETQGCYIIVEDADAHYARAKAAGAEIFIDIKTESYGGRGYSCKDLEGHLWSFGTYDPWQQQG
jgi:uncharacterized glyoxalase superfamily protein PhnB